MEKINTRILLTALVSLISFASFAHDFSVTLNGQKIYFDITSKSKKTASVTFNGSESGRKTTDLKGTIEIPPKVKHDDVIYAITAIGPKAFANAKHLEGIIIPSGIESIGDFAFEHCASLKKIVFPGNVVEFGQGIFFDCPSISSVTIGSDWKRIDLTMFRWSKALRTISIPAKIEEIKGFKRLKNLENITVDPNNEKFASNDGMLYSRNGKTLYGCPRKHKPEIKVMDGTEVIEPGALIDCSQTTKIDFPASLKSVSFRETSEMEKLQTIIMRPLNPIMTGFHDKVGKFLFVLLNPGTEIIVLNQSKAKYISLLATEAGQYSEKIGSIPYEVSESKLPVKKNFKGVKNFDKY